MAARRAEQEKRAKDRLRTGILGFWDRFTGRRRRTLRETEEARQQSLQHGTAQIAELQRRHALQQERTQTKLATTLAHHRMNAGELTQDIGGLRSAVDPAENRDKAAFLEKRSRTPTSAWRRRGARTLHGPTPGG